MGPVEGGRSNFDDKGVQDDSLVAGNSSLAEPSTAGPSAACPGELGRMHYVSIVLSCSYALGLCMHKNWLCIHNNYTYTSSSVGTQSQSST